MLCGKDISDDLCSRIIQGMIDANSKEMEFPLAAIIIGVIIIILMVVLVKGSRDQK